VDQTWVATTFLDLDVASFLNKNIGHKRQILLAVLILKKPVQSIISVIDFEAMQLLA
jgi:hypothetical protein